MASDYSIMESELAAVKVKLKRDLHMHEVRRLSKKQCDLASSVVQRKQIKNLSNQLAELESTVGTLYCPQYSLKDNEIRGYLVYLLKMKDFFTRQVATKQDLINKRESQIKAMLRKVCAVTNEDAKMMRSVPLKSPEFVRLENMSNRMGQMNKRICSMRQENKEIMENIMNMRKFQRQFKTFERDFRNKIGHLKKEAHGHLYRAVTAYEEKDEFVNKEIVFHERSAQDHRKAAINLNALSLCIQKSAKNEEFAKLQEMERTDTRIAETGKMIERGLTGIETILEKNRDLQSAIADAAGEESPDEMENSFKITDDKTDSTFSYLDELLKDIHSLQSDVDGLKGENRDFIKNMSASARKMRRDISSNQDKAQEKIEESEEVIKLKDEARNELDSLLETVKSLYTKICPGEASSLESAPIDDSNVMDILENMDNQILDYLICIEYIRMKEADQEERPVVIEEEDDEDEDESGKLELMDSNQPRILRSECDLQSLELEGVQSFLEFEELRKRAVAAMAEMQSEQSGEEDGESRDASTEKE